MNSNWPTKRLGEVLAKKPQYGLTAKSTDIGKYRYIRITDLTESGELKNDSPKFVDLNGGDFNKYKLEDGDFLIARSGSVGRIYLHQNTSKPCVYASYLIRFKLDCEKILPKFLFYYALSPNYKWFITYTLRKVAQPNINAQEFSNLQIPLPPLEIQRQIVARIEEIFEKIDKAIELRKKALEETKQIFPSALQEVFKEAERKWRVDEIKNVVINFQSGFACSRRTERGKGIPQLRPNNINSNGEIDLSSLVFIPKKLVNQNKYKLEKGDVLFNNTNSKELVGRAVLVKKDLECVFSNHITRLKTNPRILLPEWLVVNINHLWGMGYFLKYSQKWIGQAGINTRMLQAIEIPLPPLPEQKRIVSYLDDLREKVDKLEDHQESQLRELEELKQSILDRAFKGELVK
jgi:type I restriction enzyme S subunit